MNVEQVIAELAKYPKHLTVRGYNPRAIVGDLDGEHTIGIEEEHAREVSDVLFLGPDVLLECDGVML